MGTIKGSDGKEIVRGQQVWHKLTGSRLTVSGFYRGHEGGEIMVQTNAGLCRRCNLTHTKPRRPPFPGRTA